MVGVGGRLRRLGAATVLLAWAATAAAAARASDGEQLAADQAGSGWVSELRGGLLLHDRYVLSRSHGFDPFESREEGGLALNAMVLFATPGFLENPAVTLRPFLSGSLDLGGGTSVVAAGLAVGHQFEVGLFLEGFLGAALHNGSLDEGSDPDEKELGSRVLPMFGAEVGWRFGAEDRQGLSLYWEHFSHNKWLGDCNDALENWGLRYSYRF